MLNASLFLGSAYWPTSLVSLITMALGLAALQRSEPMLASAVFALPFLFAVIVPAPAARLLLAWDEQNLSTLRFVMRAALCVIVMATLIAVAAQSPWTLTVYVLLLLVGAIDQVICSTTPLWAEKLYGIDFGQTTAFSNIFGRGAQSIAPLIAASLLSNEAGGSVITFLVISSLAALYFPYVLHKNVGNADIEKQPSMTAENADNKSGMNGWALRYIAFNFFVNLAQGAVAFLLLSDGATAAEGAINATMLYSAFLLVQIAFVFKMIDLKRIDPSPKHVIAILAINGLLMVCLACTSAAFGKWLLIAIIGILYGLSIPLLSEAIMEKLRGPGYRETMAYARIAGRLSTVAALAFYGAALAGGFPVWLLLATSGLMLFAVAAGLFLIRTKTSL